MGGADGTNNFRSGTDRDNDGLMLDLRQDMEELSSERDEDELPEEDEKRCRRLLPLTSDSVKMLQIYSVERRQKWGRKERKVESEKKEVGRGTRKHDEHRDK